MQHFHSCGAKITYETSLPKACPKCGALLKDPAKVVAAITAAAVKVAAQVVTPAQEARANEVSLDDGDDIVVCRPAARSSNSRPVTRKPTLLGRQAAQARVEDAEDDNTGVDDTDDAADQGDLDDEPEDTSVDPREARRRIRQLAASIDPSTIHVGDVDEQPVTFADWCAQPRGGRR